MRNDQKNSQKISKNNCIFRIPKKKTNESRHKSISTINFLLKDETKKKFRKEKLIVLTNYQKKNI